MDCHEVFCSCLATEASASLLFHFQDSYPAFRCIVVRWHPWVFQEVEHMFSQFAEAVSDLAEWLLKLVEILIEEFVEALHPGGDVGHRLGVFIPPMYRFSQ